MYIRLFQSCSHSCARQIARTHEPSRRWVAIASRTNRTAVLMRSKARLGSVWVEPRASSADLHHAFPSLKERTEKVSG